MVFGKCHFSVVCAKKKPKKKPKLLLYFYNGPATDNSIGKPEMIAEYNRRKGE